MLLPDRSVFLGRCFQLCPVEETNTSLPWHWGSPAVLHRILRIWQASPPGRWVAECVICFRQRHKPPLPSQFRLTHHTQHLSFCQRHFLLCYRVGAVVPDISRHYSHEKPSAQRSHTCHTSAWDSRCFALPLRSGHARLWLDRSLRWPEWQPWYYLTRRSLRWSKARSNRGFYEVKVLKLFTLQLKQSISGSTRITKRLFLLIPFTKEQFTVPGNKSPGHRSYLHPEENTGKWNMIIMNSQASTVQTEHGHPCIRVENINTKYKKGWQRFIILGNIYNGKSSFCKKCCINLNWIWWFILIKLVFHADPTPYTQQCFHVKHSDWLRDLTSQAWIQEEALVSLQFYRVL